MIEYLNHAKSKYAYKDKIEVLKDQAENAKRMLLYIKKEDFKNNFPFFLILYAYKCLFLFPDKEIYAKFREFGIRENQLTWFIALGELEQLFNKTENSNIFIYRDQCLEFIIAYVSNQIMIDVCFWVGSYKIDKYGKKKPELYLELKNTQRRLKDKRIKRYQSENSYKSFMSEFVNVLYKLDEVKGFKKGAAIKIVSGESEHHLLATFVKDCFFYRSVDKNDNYFLSSIYDLCRKFLKNSTMPTEEEVDEQGIYVGKPKHTWQAHVLRNIIYGQNDQIRRFLVK